MGCWGLAKVGACDKTMTGAGSASFVGTGLSITGSSSASGDSRMSEYLFSWFGLFKILLTFGSVGETMTFGITSAASLASSP